jgi:hypothetical protein
MKEEHFKFCSIAMMEAVKFCSIAMMEAVINFITIAAIINILDFNLKTVIIKRLEIKLLIMKPMR